LTFRIEIVIRSEVFLEVAEVLEPERLCLRVEILEHSTDDLEYDGPFRRDRRGVVPQVQEAVRIVKNIHQSTEARRHSLALPASARSDDLRTAAALGRRFYRLW